MDAHAGGIEPVTISDILDLATWNRPRTSEELQRFIDARHAALVDDIDVE